MKKILFIALAIMCFVGCSETPNKKAPIESWADGIILQYPNLRSNEISKKAVLDSVSTYSQSFIGKEASLFEGVSFKFAEMVENEDSFAVFFDAAHCYSDIEYNEGNQKVLMTELNMRALGKVDKQTASTLDSEKKYSISGIVHAWDAEDKFFITHHMTDYLDFGTFILNSDIQIKEIEDK